MSIVSWRKPAVACLEHIRTTCTFFPSRLSPPSSSSSPFGSPCSAPFEPLLRSLADTSCMSPSCKRGVTRLTSIVLVDERAYRAMDRWAGDDKDHGIEMGTHRVARPVTGRYYQLFRAITRGLDFACTITAIRPRYLPILEVGKINGVGGEEISLTRAHLPIFLTITIGSLWTGKYFCTLSIS